MTSAAQVTTASEIEAGLSFLAAIIAAEGEDVPMSKAAATELSAAVEAWRPWAAPDALVARPCPQPAARWHLEHLLSTAPHDAAGRARRMFHARLLGFLLASDRPHFGPLVTVLIPVHNRAAMCAQAVESCLAQSWRPLEILVVDDGSTDDLASALRPFGDDVRLLRKANGGVSSARNVGIAAARGDFIHFLDSDDLLLPEAVECKVAAFACIPDAALCYSMTISKNLPGVAVPQIRIPDGSARCATSDLLSATLRRYPFFVPTVMMPRWAILNIGPFEEDLRRGEDSRYWVRLGLAGIKVIGLTSQLTVRRMVPDGLSVTPHVGQRTIDIRLRDLRDLLGTPSAWRYAGLVLRRLSHGLSEHASLSDESLNRIEARDQILATLIGFGDGRARDALSPVPLLVDVQNLLRLTWPSDTSADHPRSRLWRDLRAAIVTALKSAAPMTQHDLAYWDSNRSPSSRGTTIDGLFRSLSTAADKRAGLAGSDRQGAAPRESDPLPPDRQTLSKASPKARIRTTRGVADMAAAPIEVAVLIGLDQASTVRLPDNETSDAARAFLLAVIGSGGSWREAPSAAVRDQLLRLTAGWRAASAPPQDLVGRPCPMPPPAWHMTRLCDLLDEPGQPDRTADRARRLYHARCLGHLLMPEQSEFRPLVTILIPVYNRAAMTVEAVESCLAQTWRPLEILVIDDGSTDDLATALARFGKAVRIWRQPNGGVSSARNAGIRLAGGDFVHFLDSDNLLLPTAVSRKLDAFACIADAELCYSLAEIRGERALDLPRIAPPDGSARCPTTDLLAAANHPFYVSCVMLPRWTLLDAGEFEEDLRRGEDTRFWIRLGLRDTKAVALAAHLTVRRLTSDSLSVDPTLPPMAFLVRLRTIADLLRRPRGWQAAARSFPGLLQFATEQDRPSKLSDLTARGISDLLGAINALGDGSRRDGMSPLPLLTLLRHRTKGAIDLARARDGGDKDFFVRLFTAIDDAARGAALLDRSDVAFWAGAQVTHSGRSRINSFLTAVNVRLAADPALLAISDRLLRRSAVIPPEETIDSYVRLRRWRLPPRLAMWLAHRTAGAPRQTRTP